MAAMLQRAKNFRGSSQFFASTKRMSTTTRSNPKRSRRRAQHASSTVFIFADRSSFDGIHEQSLRADLVFEENSKLPGRGWRRENALLSFHASIRDKRYK